MKRRRVVAVLGVAQRSRRRGVVKTDIQPADFVLLHERLLSRPEAVLGHFAELQIECLSQIEGWDALKESDPAGAAKIIFVATTMGIREHLKPKESEVSDVDAGDAAGDDPGELVQPEGGGLS